MESKHLLRKFSVVSFYVSASSFLEQTSLLVLPPIDPVLPGERRMRLAMGIAIGITAILRQTERLLATAGTYQKPGSYIEPRGHVVHKPPTRSTSEGLQFE